MFNRILVPLDGSEESARALGPAAALARSCDAPLAVMSYPMAVSYLESHRHEIAQQVAGLDAPSIEVVVDVTDRPIHMEIADDVEAHPGTLVVMSSIGQSRLGSALGSVAEGVLRDVLGPILLIGPKGEVDDWQPGGRMMVGLDGSDTSEKVLPIAAAWSMVFGFEPWIVEVLGEGPAPAGPGDVGLETSYVARMASELRSLSNRAVEYETLHGKDAAKAMVQFAAENDVELMVVATHGRTGLARLTAGSVAMGVVHRSRCPVLVYRPAHLRG
jgi:nucleotide-binding universal stress UspA family protein